MMKLGLRENDEAPSCLARKNGRGDSDEASWHKNVGRGEPSDSEIQMIQTGEPEVTVKIVLEGS